MSARRTARHTSIALAACLALGIVPAAQALVIDNFEEGDFSLSANLAVDPSATLGGLSTTNVIGGERRVEAVQNGGNGTVDASLATSAGDDTMDLLFDAQAGGSVSGFVRLTYGQSTALNADLTADGADRFEIDVVDANLSTTPNFANLSVFLLSGTGNAFVQQTFTGLGVYEFSFASFTTVDFSDVDRIEVTFGNIGVDGPNSVSLSVTSITTNGASANMPEPATAALLAIGFIAAARRRR